MKNTQLVITMAIISIVSIHSRASAQILPVNGATLLNNHSVSTAVIQTAPVTQHVVSPVVITTAPTNAAVTPTLQVYNQVPVVNGNIHVTAINTIPTSTIVPSHVTSVTPIHIAQGINTNAIAHIDPGLVMNDPGTGNSNSGGSTGSNQNSGGSSGSSYSSGGNTVGRYPVVTTNAPAPVVVNSARPAVHTETYTAAPKKVVVKQMIPLLPEDSMDNTTDVNDYQSNNMTASVQGISGQMTLIGILVVIAGVLGLMVAVKEYRLRNQVNQQVYYA